MDQTESDRLERVTSDDEGVDAVGYAAGASRTPASGDDYDNADNASAGSGDAPDAAAEPEQLKAQIEETRSAMGDTIDAIQEKLSFSNIAEQVKETVSEQINSAVGSAQTAVYDATVGKAGGLLQSIGGTLAGLTGNLGSSLGEFTENMGKAGKGIVKKTGGSTLPLLLIGLGAGLLLVNNGGSLTGGGKKRSRRRDYDYDYEGTELSSGAATYRGGGRRRRSLLGGARETIGGALSTTTETVGGAASSAYKGVTGAAGSAYEGVTGAAGSAYEGVTGFAGTAYERAGEYGGKLQEQYSETLESNPLLIGAVAAGIGAIVGFTIPNTEYENQWLGETRDNIVMQVQGTAREAITGVYEQAKTAVTDKVSEVAKSVQEQAGGQGGAQ